MVTRGTCCDIAALDLEVVLPVFSSEEEAEGRLPPTPPLAALSRSAELSS